jgi:hypothetical protein
MPTCKCLLIAAVVCSSVSTSAFAHHSASAFDLSKEVEIEGTITKVGWMNPHVYFTVRTVGSDGTPTEQEIHAGSASALIGMGVPREALDVGRRVSERAFPARRAGARIVLGFELMTEGDELYAIEFIGGSRAAQARATVAAGGLAGRWVPQRTGEVARFAASVRERLTAAGLASAADVESYRASMVRCDALAAPSGMISPMVRDLTVDDEVIRIAVDWMGAERIIHLDQREHPADLTPSVQGHSIGRWEGDILVIDTVGFLPHRSGVWTGVASGPRKHLVEQLSLTEDKLHLKYEFTMQEPDGLIEPVSFTQLWDHRPEIQASGEACDRGVAGRFLEIE